MLPVGPMQCRISIFVLKQLDCYRTSNDLMKEARQPRRLEAINNIGARRTTLFALKNVSLFAWVLQICSTSLISMAAAHRGQRVMVAVRDRLDEVNIRICVPRNPFPFH
jgi:hypothetical protein